MQDGVAAGGACHHAEALADATADGDQADGATDKSKTPDGKRGARAAGFEPPPSPKKRRRLKKAGGKEA